MRQVFPFFFKIATKLTHCCFSSPDQSELRSIGEHAAASAIIPAETGCNIVMWDKDVYIQWLLSELQSVFAVQHILPLFPQYISLSFLHQTKQHRQQDKLIKSELSFIKTKFKFSGKTKRWVVSPADSEDYLACFEVKWQKCRNVPSNAVTWTFALTEHATYHRQKQVVRRRTWAVSDKLTHCSQITHGTTIQQVLPLNQNAHKS